MYLSSCVFLDGVHVKPGPDCPHDENTNEVGEKMKPGWTVQQADQEGNPSGYYEGQG